jgi:hypothetical protein
VRHNGEAAPRVCVPANEVSEFIELLYRYSPIFLRINIMLHVGKDVS